MKEIVMFDKEEWESFKLAVAEQVASMLYDQGQDYHEMTCCALEAFRRVLGNTLTERSAIREVVE